MLLQGVHNVDETSGTRMQQTVPSASLSCCPPNTHLSADAAHGYELVESSASMSQSTDNESSDAYDSDASISVGAGVASACAGEIDKGRCDCQLVIAFRCLANALQWLLRASLAAVVQSSRHRAAVPLRGMLRWTLVQVRDRSLIWMGRAK